MILVIIAIVVTIWTAGAASGLFAAIGGATGTGVGIVGGGAMALGGGGMLATGAGAVAAGAIGGAVGSIVSQAVGVAMGIQEKFSWNAVALAAIGGGVGASGFGNAAAKAVGAVKGLANTAVSAMAGNALTQGISVATGLQDKFSWAGVAAAGIGAVAFQIASNRLPGAAHAEVTKGPKGVPVKVDVPATAANRFGASMASTVADAATRSLIEGSDFGDNIMAALPNVIGNTIGEAIAGGISKQMEKARNAREQERQLEASRRAAEDKEAYNRSRDGDNATLQTIQVDERWLEEHSLTGPGAYRAGRLRRAFNQDAGIYPVSGRDLRFIAPEDHVPSFTIDDDVSLSYDDSGDRITAFTLMDPDLHIYEYIFNMGPVGSVLDHAAYRPVPNANPSPASRGGTDNNASPVPGPQDLYDAIGDLFFFQGSDSGFGAGVYSYDVIADDGRRVITNMSKRSHGLQGIVAVFESQVGGDTMLHFYGFGRGPAQDPRNPLSIVGNWMDQQVWTGNAIDFGWNRNQGIARVLDSRGNMVTTQIGRDYLSPDTR